jgi:hypothetical protein
MIDFVRLRYLDKSMIEPFIFSKDNFNVLHAKLECHTGEITYPYTTNIGNMEIRVNDKSVYIKNSLHKLHNKLISDKSHNYNDFSYSELCETINYLGSKLINVNETRLTQLEFGLNIKLPLPAEDVIKNNIILHKFALHNHNEQFNGKGEYKQFNHYKYYFKIYDKAKQYNIEEHIIRIEIKYKNSKGFNSLGIVNINDLKKKKLLKALFDDLLKRFDELTIVDNIPSEMKISNLDKQKLERYLSFNYWIKLSERVNRNKKHREKIAFQKLLIKYNLLKTKTLIKEGLNNKFRELISR